MYLRLSQLSLLFFFFVVFAAVPAAYAQTTTFVFKANLPKSATPATDVYEMEFKLFDAAAGGNQIGTTQTISNVEVKNREFSVLLDFGAEAFPGADRFLEVSYRRYTGEPFTTVSLRWQMFSVPYAIRSLKATMADTATTATQLDGVDASQFVQTDDPRLSDSRAPNAGSGNYIQNRTTTQSGASFNIDGNGTVGGTLSANTVNSGTQYNIAGTRVLSTPGFHLFVGIDAGHNNTTSNFNSFVGSRAGFSNTTGSNNSFFGYNAGYSNTTGFANLFVGSSAGFSNTTGSNNSFVGVGTGYSNTTGSVNSFVGIDAGYSNTEGSANSFVGYKAGYSNTTGETNSFFGINAGYSNTEGSDNSFIGVGAGFSNTTGSGNLFVGSSAGSLNTTGDRNSFVGFLAGTNNTTGEFNTSLGYNADVTTGDLSFATAIGAQARVSTSNTIVLGRTNGADKVRIYGLGAAGSTDLCRNSDFEISTCSSSLRYKTNIAPFNFGLSLVSKLKPITFNWKAGGMADLGLGAEDVAEIEPLLVTYNKDGQVEGVKYDRIGIVLLNAVKEQQAQIKTQQTQIDEQKETIKRQQTELDALKKLVCLQNLTAEFCKQQN